MISIGHPEIYTIEGRYPVGHGDPISTWPDTRVFCGELACILT